MRTIVVTNERGGIGKTTLTCHIAWHLAEQGKRVVVLDLDKQCHSAGMLKAEFEQIGPVQSILDFARSEEHTSELQSLMRISYAVFCLKKKTNNNEAPIEVNTNNIQLKYTTTNSTE